MDDLDKHRRWSEEPDAGEGDLPAPRLAPGKRSLTDSIGQSGAPHSAGPGKVSLTHGLSAPMALPYQREMESAFGQDFGGVTASRTDPAALGGAQAMAQGESVAFTSDHPSQEMVAHELAHVVQHRQGLTDEALAWEGDSALDRAADRAVEVITGALAAGHTSRARLPRPLVIEVIGDRFRISFQANHVNELTMRVQYQGPHQAAGEHVEHGTLVIPTPRLGDGIGTALNVSVLEVGDRRVLLDLTGAGEEIAELTFDPVPHAADPDARTHLIKTRTGNTEGSRYRMHILLPSAERPTPEGLDEDERARLQVASHPIALGPDCFTLRARRFGESSQVQLSFQAIGSLGEHQSGPGSMLVPVASATGPLCIRVLGQEGRDTLVDLDGDGEVDARLVHTATATGSLLADGTQVHEHFVDAYDPQDVKLAQSRFTVRGQPWDVPATLDRALSPPPETAATPAARGPVQGDTPVEGALPVVLPNGEWELRLDADGDRQKELLLRFLPRDPGEPIDVRVIQVSTGYHSSFVLQSWENNVAGEMNPRVSRAADGINPAQVRLFQSVMAGFGIHMAIEPPTAAADGDGRVYAFHITSPSEEATHRIRFPAEELTGSPLAADIEVNKARGGIHSLTARLGPLGDPFLFTIEQAPGGLTLGIAGLNPDGTPGETSGVRLRSLPRVQGIRSVGVSSTRLCLDITGDGEPDIIVHDAIGAPLQRDSSAQLSVERSHQMHFSGPAVGADAGATFELRGRTFRGGSSPSQEGREGAGAAAAVSTFVTQEQEGNDIEQLLPRFRAGISAQILRAGEKGVISEAMVSAWRGLSEDMIRLEAFTQVAPDRRASVAASEREVRSSAAAHAKVLVGELFEATKHEGTTTVPARGLEQHRNPYTDAQASGTRDTTGMGWGPWQYTALDEGPAAGLAAAISSGDDAEAARLWASLQDGVERWAQTRIERELGPDSELARQGQYMRGMSTQLGRIRGKRNLQRVHGTFIADDSYRDEEGFFQTLPLQLWVWQDEDDHWYIRDLTNPEKPFEGDAGPEYHRVNHAGQRPSHYPPHHLFQQLNDKKKFPKGLVRYQIPGSDEVGQVVCEAKMKWYEYAQYAALALAAAGLTLVTFGTAGGLVAVAGSYLLAASAVAGAVAAGGELADAYEHGWLDGMVVMLNLTQIVASVASAGAIVAGNLVRGARAASAAVDAGTEGAALWTGRAARLAAMADRMYIPLTATALGGDVASVVVLSADMLQKLKEIDENLPEGQATEAKIKLLAMFALTGGLTVLSIKGDLPQIRDGRTSIVLDTIQGVPVAYAGGVRAGGVEIPVSRMGPDGAPVPDANLHASARWQTRESAEGLTDAEAEWYRAWMGQEQKVRFRPDGTPEIILPQINGRTPPPEVEAKLRDMVRSSDVAFYDAAWARTGDLDALREASGGHLDIDPASPTWPAERERIREQLTRSLGSRRRAEEVLSRYEAFRTGAHGPGAALHADQAARLGRVLPEHEVDTLRAMFPECEVYVSGDVVSAGASAPHATVDVVVVVPAGTTPDLMAAMEQRAAAVRLRPDPDYIKAHPSMGTDTTLAVKAKAVTPDQLFGMTTARVDGRPPLELHRLDVPTGPGGQAYTAAELDAMNRAGYQYDPATGTFTPRSAQTRATLAGTNMGALRGPNTLVGGALPSEAVGQEVLRKLALGDAEALRVVGVEPPVDFDPRSIEWGLGIRESDGAFVLIRGEPGGVDWGVIPGVTGRGHSHPILDPITRKPRMLSGEGGTDWTTVDQLAAGKGGNSLMYLAPSGSDFAYAAAEGRHLVATPYVHLGGGRIGNPRPNGLDSTVEFDILHAEPDGLWGAIVVYKARVVMRAGDEVLFDGHMWGLQTPAFSDVKFRRHDGLTDVPADLQVGRWRYDVGAPGGATTAGNDALVGRLRGAGLPDPAADPNMAKLVQAIDPATEIHLTRLLDLMGDGKVRGLDDWYKGLAENPSDERIANMFVELREARRLSDENPGAVIDLGADARAPNRYRNGVRTDEKDASFDIEVHTADGVAWSSEVKTLDKKVMSETDLTETVKATAEKVRKRSTNPEGAIPGKRELRMDIRLFQGEKPGGGYARSIYDGAGKISRVDAKGDLIGRPPNPINIFDEVAENLSKRGSSSMQHLDRVTLVDATGILARYDKVGSTFVRVQ